MRHPRETERLGMAALLLDKIRQNPSDLVPLLGLQRFLLRQIFRVEYRIKRLKSARGRMLSLLRKGSSKECSSALKALISKTQARTEDLHQLLFLWKCFGDGIACTYQSSYSLKHLYFDADYGIKSDPGFITGKAGFVQEYRLMRKGIRWGVPAILSDLTNIIRHGDVCLMGAADPVPIEVKSSKNTNARVRRQLEQLRLLREFYDNDGAAIFRGVPNVRRIETVDPVLSYEAVFNECMVQAQVNGVDFRSPEPGLTYICGWNVSRDDRAIVKALNNHLNDSTLLLGLTPDASWLPAKSFTVTMTPANAVLFMQEKYTCGVLIDLAVLKQLLEERDLNPVMVMDGTSAIQIAPRMSPDRQACDSRKSGKAPSEAVGIFRISEFHLLRSAMQFESLRWFADCVASQMQTLREEGPTEFQGNEPFLSEIPESWLTAEDCLQRVNNRELGP